MWISTNSLKQLEYVLVLLVHRCFISNTLLASWNTEDPQDCRRFGESKLRTCDIQHGICQICSMASSCRMLCIQGHPKRKTLSNIGEDEVGKEGFFPHQPFDHYSFGLFDKQCLELMPLILFDISEVFDLMIPLCAFAVQRSSAVWYTTCWSSFFLSPKIVVFVFPSQAATRLAQLVKLRDEFRRRAIMAMKAGREWDHWITAVAQDEVLHIDSRVWCAYIILYIYIFIIILYI